MDANNKKITIKKLIIPIMAIAIVTLIAIGASYAFFGYTAQIDNNINLSVTTPDVSNKTCSISKTDCSLVVDMDTMSNALASTSSVSNSTCGVTILCNGTKGDSCTYNIKLENVATPDIYKRSTTLPKTVGSKTYNYEYSGTLLGDATKAETQMDTLDNTIIASNQTIQIQNTNVEVSKTYTLQTKFYNIDADQSGLLKEDRKTTYTYNLKIVDLNCNWNH